MRCVCETERMWCRTKVDSYVPQDVAAIARSELVGSFYMWCEEHRRSMMLLKISDTQ